MNTHEMLKEICKKIGYKLQLDEERYSPEYAMYKTTELYDSDSQEITASFILDEREIIYTVEFLSKFENYLNNYDVWRDSWKEDFYKIIENPTEYLYNLLINYGPDADDN